MFQKFNNGRQIHILPNTIFRDEKTEKYKGKVTCQVYDKATTRIKNFYSRQEMQLKLYIS